MKIAKILAVLLGSISFVLADPSASVEECTADIDPNSIELVKEPGKVVEDQNGNIPKLVKPGKEKNWDKENLNHICELEVTELTNRDRVDAVEPPNRTESPIIKTFSLKTTAFLIVDVQRGFLYECAGGTGSNKKDYPARVGSFFFQNINKITKLFEGIHLGWTHVFASKDWHPGNHNHNGPYNNAQTVSHISFETRYMQRNGLMMEASVGFGQPKERVKAHNKYKLTLLHPDNTTYKEITVNVFPVHCVQGTPSAEFPAGLYQLDKGNNWTVVHKGVDRNTEYFTAFVEYPDVDEEYMQKLPHRVNLRTRLWGLFQVKSQGSSLLARTYYAMVDTFWKLFNCNTVRTPTLVNVNNPSEVIKPTVLIAGLVFEICIKATALSAITAGFEVYVLLDAVGYVSYHGGVNRIQAFEDMEKAGVKFITADQIRLVGD